MLGIIEEKDEEIDSVVDLMGKLSVEFKFDDVVVFEKVDVIKDFF